MATRHTPASNTPNTNTPAQSTPSKHAPSKSTHSKNTPAKDASSKHDRASPGPAEPISQASAAEGDVRPAPGGFGSQPVPPDTSPLHEDDIARRAYELWKADGSPDGRSTDHWFEAQRQLETDRRTAAAVR